MINIAQIRAARALLDWSQSDLADQAGLSQTGIARIENGTNKPNSSTINKILMAFDNADIEFIGETGVKKRAGEIITLHGRLGFQKMMDDVYEAATKGDANICLFNGMPSKFIEWLGQEWYAMHVERMRKISVPFSIEIVVDSNENQFIASDFAQYKKFPSALFRQKTFYAYGSKLAFMHF